ncbi:MAG: type I pantothenate kinase [Angustibacter sp.]
MGSRVPLDIVHSGNGGGPAVEVSPYLELGRADWAALRAEMPLPLTAEEVGQLTGLGDQITLDEVEQVYLPLSRLLAIYCQAADQRYQATRNFLGNLQPRVPFVVGIAGSVAVGKSTTARLLRSLLAEWPDHRTVQLVTTDGFLLPNAELDRRNILHRKGFPESYDRRALLRFLTKVKAGQPSIAAPVYSHLRYDVIPEEYQVIDQPSVLIVEGLNVLQPPRPDRRGRSGLAVSDFFDFSIYVDAKPQNIRHWYVERFLRLRATAFSRTESYFHRYAQLSDEAARQTAQRIWAETNEPNLRENILPTRSRASLVLTKGEDHAVTRVRLRKS